MSLQKKEICHAGDQLKDDVFLKSCFFLLFLEDSTFRFRSDASENKEIVAKVKKNNCEKSKTPENCTKKKTTTNRKTKKMEKKVLIYKNFKDF